MFFVEKINLQTEDNLIIRRIWSADCFCFNTGICSEKKISVFTFTLLGYYEKLFSFNSKKRISLLRFSFSNNKLWFKLLDSKIIRYNKKVTVLRATRARWHVSTLLGFIRHWNNVIDIVDIWHIVLFWKLIKSFLKSFEIEIISTINWWWQKILIWSFFMTKLFT